MPSLLVYHKIIVMRFLPKRGYFFIENLVVMKKFLPLSFTTVEKNKIK